MSKKWSKSTPNILMGIILITHRTILWATAPPQSAQPTAGELWDPNVTRLPKSSVLNKVKVVDGEKAQDPEEKGNAGCSSKDDLSGIETQNKGA